MIKPSDDQKRADIHAESKAVERAVQESVREAMLEHKRLGLPAVEWRDGRVVWVPAEEIKIIPPPDDDSQDAKPL